MELLEVEIIVQGVVSQLDMKPCNVKLSSGDLSLDGSCWSR